MPTLLFERGTDGLFPIFFRNSATDAADSGGSRTHHSHHSPRIARHRGRATRRGVIAASSFGAGDSHRLRRNPNDFVWLFEEEVVLRPMEVAKKQKFSSFVQSESQRILQKEPGR